MKTLGKAIFWLMVGATATGFLIYVAIKTPIKHDDIGALGTILFSFLGFIKNIFIDDKSIPHKKQLLLEYKPRHITAIRR